jgi:hypothetical protein
MIIIVSQDAEARTVCPSQQTLKYAPASARASETMSNPIQIFLGIVMVVFLPGYTLVNMLFPRKGELDPEYDLVYRITLGMGTSVVISILVGFGLNAISTEGHGFVTAGPLWASLLGITGLFTLLGWLRGAYPSAGYLHPSLYRPPPSSKEVKSNASEFDRRRRLDKYILEREALLTDLKVFAERSTTSDPQRKMYYRKRIDQARERMTKVNEEISRLGSEGA